MNIREAVCPVRLTGSVRARPAGATVRRPVAWVASVEETKRRKSTDQAILGMVSKSPGRNATEPRSGLERNEIRRPSPLLPGEGSMTGGSLTDAAGHVGRVVGTARGHRACRATGETILVPTGNRWSKVGRITGAPGKAVESETAADGSGVARKVGTCRQSEETRLFVCLRDWKAGTP